MNKPEQPGSSGHQKFYNEQRGVVEMRDNNNKRGYIGLIVATMLARARRDFDNTDDITADVAKCKIGEGQKPSTNPKNRFSY